MFVYPKNPTALEIISVAIQLAFNYWVYLYFGKLTFIKWTLKFIKKWLSSV